MDLDKIRWCDNSVGGKIIPLNMFRQYVDASVFIDKDGVFYLGTLTHQSNVKILPSEVACLAGITKPKILRIHPVFTHVAFYKLR